MSKLVGEYQVASSAADPSASCSAYGLVLGDCHVKSDAPETVTCAYDGRTGLPPLVSCAMS